MAEPPTLPGNVSDSTKAHADPHQTGARVKVNIKGSGSNRKVVDARVINKTTAIGGSIVLAIVLIALAAYYFRGKAADDAQQQVRDLAGDVCLKIAGQGELPPMNDDGTWTTEDLVQLVLMRADVADQQAARLERARVPQSLAADVDNAVQRVGELAQVAREVAPTITALAGDTLTMEELQALSTSAEQQQYLQKQGSAQDALSDVSRTPCPPHD